MDIAIAITFVGLLIFLAHLFTAVFSRTRIPDVLLLAGIGALLGPALGIVTPEHLGKVGPVFAQIALALILFEGGQDTRLDVMRRNWAPSLALIGLAFSLTLFAAGALVHAATDLGWNRSLMIGAILANTSSAIVIPMVRQLRMGSGPGFILIMESAVTDVLCIIAFLGLMQAQQMGEASYGAMAGNMLWRFALAAAIGVVAGVGWSMILERLRAVQNNIFLTPALVFVLYGAFEALGVGGAVVVLFFGMGMANAGAVRLPSFVGAAGHAPAAFSRRERAFFAELVFLIKTFFFVYMGLSLRFSDAKVMLLAFALIAAALALRIPSVWLTLPRSISRRDASMIAVMAPKGLASAVLASIPFQAGMEGGELIRDLIFAAILFSILLNSLLIVLIDKTRFGSRFSRIFVGFGKGRPAREGGPSAEPAAFPGGSAELEGAPGRVAR